jgi:hypothetical protein
MSTCPFGQSSLHALNYLARIEVGTEAKGHLGAN